MTISFQISRLNKSEWFVIVKLPPSVVTLTSSSRRSKILKMRSLSMERKLKMAKRFASTLLRTETTDAAAATEEAEAAVAVEAEEEGTVTETEDSETIENRTEDTLDHPGEANQAASEDEMAASAVTDPEKTDLGTIATMTDDQTEMLCLLRHRQALLADRE